MTFKIHCQIFVTSLCAVGILYVTAVKAETDYTQLRKELVRNIEKTVRETAVYIGVTKLDPRVMKVISELHRHEFVPDSYKNLAYENQPLPIGYGQTISQPYIVALMTDLLSIKPTDKALEIGTGSGYQAAVLAGLADEVFTIEIIKELAERASAVLVQQGYKKIQTRIADGYYGWKEHAPFDVIVVTAAHSHVPPPLLQQLKPGGRMVIPVGSRFIVQQLVLIKKDLNGKISSRQILPVRFVPLTGGHD